MFNNLKNIKLLHITAHLGGGVGAVLSNFALNVKCNQSFACFDKVKQKDNFEGHLLVDDMINKIDQLKNMISSSDVVLFHMWNHPLIYKFLLETEIPKCRLIMWSHTLGIYPPYIIEKNIIDLSDVFILATPASYNIPCIKNMSKQDVLNKIKVIRSIRNIDNFIKIKKIKHNNFNVGYIGTLDYCKLHSDFIEMCVYSSENNKFILCGEISKSVLDDIKKYKDKNIFLIEGKISDVEYYLSMFDVFGYILSPQHYGTGEQSLGEAMAAGVVPIVFNNLPESYIVENKYNGLVVSDKEEFKQAINKLKYDKKFYDKLSSNARKTAKNIYSTNNIKAWNKVIKNILDNAKTEKCLLGNIKLSGYDIFIKSLGEYGELLTNLPKNELKNELRLNHQWNSISKGSPRHYLQYFPNDTNLIRMSKMLDNL